MRVITEAQLVDRKRMLREARRELRRKDRQYAAEEMFVDGLLASLVDVVPDATPRVPEAVQEAPTATPPPTSPATTETAVTQGAAEHDAPVFVRRPASEDSPVSKVQIPLLALVAAEPGILRADAQRNVATQVGTTVQSVRESVRRMVKAKKLQQVGERLYPADMKVERADVQLFEDDNKEEAAGG